MIALVIPSRPLSDEPLYKLDGKGGLPDPTPTDNYELELTYQLHFASCALWVVTGRSALAVVVGASSRRPRARTGRRAEAHAL